MNNIQNIQKTNYQLITLILLFVLSLSTSWAKTEVLSSGGVNKLTKEEKKLLEETAIFEEEINRKGLIYHDPILEKYVNEIGKKLISNVNTSTIKFRFQIIKDPALNAFALPNGSIYIHSGLLSQLENEAQLAHILGHEITHVIKQHAVNAYKDFKNKLMLANVVDVLGSTAIAGASIEYLSFFSLGLGLTMSAAINGYGRENEKEADDTGMELMINAGYQLQEVPKVYELLLKEYGDATNLEVFFMGSHPANKERIQRTTELLKTKYADKTKQTALITNIEEFQQQTKNLIKENAILNIRADRYHHAISGLEKVIKSDPKDQIAHYYLGESYRLIVKYPEKTKQEEEEKRTSRKQKKKEITPEEKKEKLSVALKEYDLALAYNPQYPDPHRGLGLVYWEQGKEEQSIDEFEKYLTLCPMAKDRRQVTKYLEELKNKKEENKNEVK